MNRRATAWAPLASRAGPPCWTWPAVLAALLAAPAGAAFDLDHALNLDLAVVAQVGGIRVVQVLENPLNPMATSFAVNVGGDANFVLKGLFNNDGFEHLVTVNADQGPTGGSVTVLLNTPAPPMPGCPWDCAFPHDGVVGIVDFLALLNQWAQVGSSCDINGGGVGVPDLLAVLAHWGSCP